MQFTTFANKSMQLRAALWGQLIIECLASFSISIQQAALRRQRHRCGSSGTRISQLGNAGRSDQEYGEGARAHHIVHAKFVGPNTLNNCVILCESCHYSAHEGGNYRYGRVCGAPCGFSHTSQILLKQDAKIGATSANAFPRSEPEVKVPCFL